MKQRYLCVGTGVSKDGRSYARLVKISGSRDGKHVFISDVSKYPGDGKFVMDVSGYVVGQVFEIAEQVQAVPVAAYRADAR